MTSHSILILMLIYCCIQEVVQRFESQKSTTRHLEELKKDNEKQITRLKEEKEKLQQEFEEMKYSGDAKLSGLVVAFIFTWNYKAKIKIFFVSAKSTYPLKLAQPQKFFFS